MKENPFVTSLCSGTVYFTLSSIRPSRYTSGEFKTQLQRRGGQRLLKMTFYFTYETRGTFKSFTLFITVETITKVPLGHGDKFEKEINKNTRRGSRCSDNAELSHFTLLFLKVRQRNVPRIITHVNNHCSDH